MLSRCSWQVFLWKARSVNTGYIEEATGRIHQKVKKMKPLLSVIAVGVYLGAVTSLMYLNTTYLDLGDPKFGQNGWTFYWWVWALMYLPPLVFGVTLNWIKNEKGKDIY